MAIEFGSVNYDYIVVIFGIMFVFEYLLFIIFGVVMVILVTGTRQ